MYKNIFISHKSEYEEPTVYLDDDVNGMMVFTYQPYNYAYKKNQVGTYTSIHGDKLSKVTHFSYGQEGLFESDVPKETRVLTDLYLNDDLPSENHVVLTLDIEVDSEGGFAMPNIADKRITGIACHTSDNDQYTSWVLDPVSQSSKGTQQITIGLMTNYIYTFRDEDAMLEDFLQWYIQTKPSIITGWNVDKFDIPYLYNRLLNVFDARTANKLSPIEHVKFSKERMRYTLGCVSVLDYLPLYKKFTYIQQPSYRLDEIGKFEVNMGKVEYEGTLHELWQNDIDKFVQYNLNDVKIVVALDKKMKLIELVRAICHMGHVPYEDYSFSSRFIEGTIITYLHRKGIICTNKPVGGREMMEELEESKEKGFSGAYVKEPIAGKYDWVYSLDLESLYPSIIMSLNISPETKVGKISEWDVDKYMKKEVDNYVLTAYGTALNYTKDEIKSMLETQKLVISSNGVLYRTDKTGIIPEILSKWFSDRKLFKSKMKDETNKGNKDLAEFYDRRQHVQKILLNSIYGTLGLPVFRFYDLDNAAAVTGTGQDVIKNTAKFINLRYQKETDKKEDYCIYIDTDSVYFPAGPVWKSVGDESEKNATIRIARQHELFVNKFYDVMAKRMFNCDAHRLHIKGESVMSSAFWVAKKMYALKKVYDLETDQNVDKLIVKGLAVVRSQTPPAFRDLMKEILNDILNGVTKDIVDKKILNFRDILTTLSVEKVARNTAVKEITKYEKNTGLLTDSFPKGTPAHVKAAMAYNRLLKQLGKEKINAPIRDGDKIKYVFLKKNQYNLETIAFKTYDDPQEVIDLITEFVDYYDLFDRELAGKLEEFYSAMKWGVLPTTVNQAVYDFFEF
jgi:DNA polymerase elongation subunit (family B)